MTFFMAPSFCCPNAIDPEMSVGGDDYAAVFVIIHGYHHMQCVLGRSTQ